MNAKDFLDLMGEIDGDLIVNAKQPVAPRRAPAWRKLTVIAAAACLLVGVLSALVLIGMQQNVGDELPMDTETVIESPEESPPPDHGADSIETPTSFDTTDQPEDDSQIDAPSTEHETTNDAPLTATFSTSMQDIELFIQAANGSEEAFAQYAEQSKLYHGINQNMAQEISDNISPWTYPFLLQAENCDDFGATYYISYTPQVLDIIYKIDDVRYRFSYSYNYIDKHEYEGKTAVDTVTLGNYTFDIYDMDGYFVGSYTDNTLQMSLKIFTDDLNAINLEQFEFRKFGS